MKAHIGVDADSGLVHSARGTSGNVNDLTEAVRLLHRQEADAFGSASYRGGEKRSDAKAAIRSHVDAPRIAPGLDRDKPVDALIDQHKRTKVSIHAKVAPCFGCSSSSFSM